MTGKTENHDSYKPYIIGNLNNVVWSNNTPWPLIIAKFCNKYIPRGKGWFPRAVSRFMNKKKHYYIKTKYGSLLSIAPNSLDVYTHMLNHGRTWNESVFNTCKSFLKDGDVFYDIGANVGYFTLEMAKVFNDKIKIISIEPQSSLTQAISLSIKLNEFKNIEVFDLMIGKNQGEKKLYLTSHTIHASSVPRESKYSSLNKKITTLDLLVETNSIPPPNVIKIDIEGGELDALSGAIKTISKFQPYIIFESDINMERFKYTRKELLNLIEAQNSYNFFYIGNDNLIPINNDNLFLDYSDILAKPVL
jgi:FkbM family methyltransferase